MPPSDFILYKMISVEKIIIYIRLCRMQITGLIASLSVIGAVLMGQRDPFLLFIVFLIGVMYQVFLYVLNEYIDIEVDKQSSDLQRKPLVSGVIPEFHALIIVTISIVLAYLLTIIYFFNIFTILVLSCAIILGIVYDCFGKKLPGLGDFVMAGSLSFAFLFGASTLAVQFTMVVLLIALIFFFFTVYANAVEGGLKDVDHDYLGGAKTLATVMGVKVKENQLIIPKRFQLFSWILEIISIALIIYLAKQPELNIMQTSFAIQVTIGVLIAICFVSTYMFNRMKQFDRDKMKKLFAVINSSSGALILIMILPIIGWEITALLLILPISWYAIFNIILYGKPMQPDI